MRCSHTPAHSAFTLPHNMSSVKYQDSLGSAQSPVNKLKLTSDSLADIGQLSVFLLLLPLFMNERNNAKEMLLMALYFILETIALTFPHITASSFNSCIKGNPSPERHVYILLLLIFSIKCWLYKTSAHNQFRGI